MRRSSALLGLSGLVLLAATTSCGGSATASAGAPPPAVAPQPAVASPPPARTNPFFAASTLPYEAPPFDRIQDADYEPAFDEGMKQGLAEMRAIADNPEPPTFANTLEAMERSERMLERVDHVFFPITSSNTNDTLQAVKTRLAPRLAEHADAIHLDAKLYARVHAVYEARASLASAEDRYLAERTEEDFVRAGARLSEADKATLRGLNKEESTLSTEFEKRLLAATAAGALVTANPDDLEGLSEAELAAAKEAARSRKLEGQLALPLQNTTQQPAQVSLKKRATREKLFIASTQRSEHGDANDDRTIIQRLAALRATKAKLLGYPSWAAYKLVDQMARTPERAIKLMTDMVPAAVQKAHVEAARMQQLADREAHEAGSRAQPFKLAAWDWQHYADKVRKADYAFDDAQVKPYLELDRVLKDGVFFAAGKLYGLTFKERHDIPVYQPDVRVFEVFDETGKPVALFYADYFKRDNKQGGAWMTELVGQSTLLGTLPIVTNTCNFTKPAPGQPALLSFSDVITMFHEFGHALHGMSSKVKYPSLAGTNVPRDFVEFPSQFNENWATESTVLASYAKHWQTGEPMPAELLKKVQKERQFNQGFMTSEYLAAALLDMSWHTLPAGAPDTDVDAFETKSLEHFKIANPLVPPRYRSTYFAHIWGNGYSAGYYAYLWSEVLDHDAFAWFTEHGGMTRENGKRFQEMVLSRGHTEPLDAMYRKFRGHDPSVEPLLEFRGLKGGGAAKAK
jgi:peptidyl-dipeptidase Dcp